MSLTDVLPVEPVIPTTGQPSSRRQARARRCRAASGSARGEHPAGAPPRPRAPDSAAARSESTTTPQAPAASAAAACSPPSARSPRSPKKRSPGPASRESITARSGCPPAPSRTISPPTSAAIRSGASSITDCTAASASSSSRATSRSSKGIFRPSSNSWPCSWPLPAITTVSPGSASPERERDRRPAVGLDLDPRAARADPLADLGDDRLRVLRARVVGGDHGEVGEPVGDRPHQRALLAVAVAAAAEDADQPPVRRGDLPRRDEHVLERVGGVGVVDEDRERLALVDRLEAARHALGVGERGDRVAEPDPERQRASAIAQSAFSTLKRPGRGSATSTSPSAAASAEARAGGVEAQRRARAGRRARRRRPRR